MGIRCPKITATDLVAPSCSTSVQHDNYSVDQQYKHIYKNGVLFGDVQIHNRAKRTITFKVVSDNRFMNGTIRTLNY